MDRRNFVKWTGLGALTVGPVVALYLKQIYEKIEPGRLKDKFDKQNKERSRVNFTIQDMLGVKEHWKLSYTVGGNRKKIDDSINRMNIGGTTYNRKVLKDIFIRNGVEPLFVDLSIIESGFELNLTSPAGAVGPFQFTKMSGRLFGVVNRIGQNPPFDYRRDPLKSADAAARHVKENLERFKRAPTKQDQVRLAVAAYNGSFANVYARMESRRKVKPTYDGYLNFMNVLLNKYIRDNNQKRIAGLLENLSYVMEFEAVSEIVQEKKL